MNLQSKEGSGSPVLTAQLVVWTDLLATLRASQVLQW